MTSEKIVYKSKRNINDEIIDEKLRTQTFRFTNQFKSEDGADPNYFKGEEVDDENIYGEFIEEEIDSKSQDSPRNNTRPMNLIKKNGPLEIPSDTNPFKNKRNAHDESADVSEISTNKPPKVPSKLNSNNIFQSPAQQIFRTSKQKQNQKQSEHNYKDLVLGKQNSEPIKHVVNMLPNKVEKEESKIDYFPESDAPGISSSQNLHPKSEVELVLQKIRSEYTKESLMKCPFKSPIANTSKANIGNSDDEN